MSGPVQQADKAMIKFQPYILALLIGLAVTNGISLNALEATGGDQVAMRSSQSANDGRLLIEWLKPIKVLQKREGDRLVLRFSRSLSIDAKPALDRLATYLDVDRTTVDDTDLTLALRPDVIAELEISKGKNVVISFKRKKPSDPNVKFNVSTLRNGIRIVLGWPQPINYTAKQQDRDLIVTFASKSHFNPTDLVYLNKTLQPWFSRVQQREHPAGTSLIFDLRPMIVSSVRNTDGQRVEIDLTRDASTLSSNPSVKPGQDAKSKSHKSASTSESHPPPIPKLRPKIIDEQILAEQQTSDDEEALLESSTEIDELVFDWGEKKVGLAAFKRANYLWVVFDSPPELANSILPPPAPLPLMTGEMIPSDNATVIRFQLKSDINFHVRQDNFGRWFIQPGYEVKPPNAVTISSADSPGILRATALSKGKVITVEDPLVGDQINVWPLQAAGVGQPRRRRFVDLEFLPSLQGLVWRSINDDIMAKATPNGIDFSSERGLILSGSPTASFNHDASLEQQANLKQEKPDHDAPSMKELVSRPEDSSEKPALKPEPTPATPLAVLRGNAASGSPLVEPLPATNLGLAGFGLDRKLVAEARRALRQAIAKATPEERDRARLDLARLLVAEKFSSEAQIVLDRISESADAPVRKSRRALHGASALLTGDLDEASTLLRGSEFDEDDEIGVWRAALNSRDKDWEAAADGWNASSDTLNSYPSKLRFELGLLALETAIETNNDTMIREGIQRLKALELRPHELAKIDQLHARRALRDGDQKRAREILQTLVDGRYPDLSIVADFELLSLAQNDEKEDPRLLAALHSRLPLWRGHPQEINMIDRLARRYRDAKRPREALRLWAYLATIHPEIQDDLVIQDMRHATFADAITKLAGQEISYYEAYSIYLDFVDLLPKKPGDHLVHRNLANHLTELDLLNEAVLVLQPLFQSEGEERARAEIGREIAGLLLVLGRPDEALTVLDRIEPRGRINPTALEVEWQIMRARALTRLNREDEALRQIQDLQTSNARHLRAEIFWRQRNWNRLASVVELFLQDTNSSLPLDNDDQKLVLWLAMAWEQLGKTKQLSGLRQRYAAEMASGPWSEAFIVGTQTEIPSGDINAALRHTETQLTELERFRKP